MEVAQMMASMAAAWPTVWGLLYSRLSVMAQYQDGGFVPCDVRR